MSLHASQHPQSLQTVLAPVRACASDSLGSAGGVDVLVVNEVPASPDTSALPFSVAVAAAAAALTADSSINCSRELMLATGLVSGPPFTPPAAGSASACPATTASFAASSMFRRRVDWGTLAQGPVLHDATGDPREKTHSLVVLCRPRRACCGSHRTDETSEVLQYIVHVLRVPWY